MNKNSIKTGAGVFAALALVFATASTASAATFTNGHTDIVSVTCSSTGALTIDTYREDVGHISPANIGSQTFSFDASDSNGALTYGSNVWTASGDEVHENDIPFIGFQYVSAGSTSLCPPSLSFDVSKVTGSTNAGNAVFTANDPQAGSTSSASLNTSKTTVWRPNTSGKPSHQHGAWTFAGPSTGGTYTLKFDVFVPGTGSPVGTISPVNITVQP